MTSLASGFFAMMMLEAPRTPSTANHNPLINPMLHPRHRTRRGSIATAATRHSRSGGEYARHVREDELAEAAASWVAEVRQELRRKLLVADGEAPRIADYSGRADLRTWLRTSAIRISIDLIRRRRDVPIEDEELAIVPALSDDPELAHMKDRYRDELRAAIGEAIAQLEPRDRLLLKYCYIDGLSIDRIGALY